MAGAPLSSRKANRGSVIKPLYGEREMKIYAIHEAELTTLSMFSTATAACWGSATFALGFLLNAVIAFANPQSADRINVAVMMVSLLVIVVSAVVGRWFSGQKKSQLDQIKNTSRIVEGPSAPAEDSIPEADVRRRRRTIGA